MSETKEKTESKTNGSFSFKLENSKILKNVIETLSSIIDETQITITEKDLFIKAMDPSRICLLQFLMKKEDFDEFKCSSKEIVIGLNLDDLDKILKRSSANDSLEISFSEKDNKIKIVMRREGQSRARTFSLGIIDLEAEEIQMEKLLQIEYNTKWQMKPEFFVEAIKDAEIYSEILNMKAEEKKGLIFSSSGQIGEMVYELTEDDLFESTISDTNTGSYSITFLKAILKIASITERLEISLFSDNPLKMIFNILEGAVLSYFLAPRVENENDDFDDDMEEF